jgi:hypothetical protein
MGITRPNISPYSFRHSMATSLLEQDVNIHKIAKLLGHSIEQTAQYEHLTTKDIQEAVAKHPLIRKYTEPGNILKDIKEMIISYRLDKDDRFAYKICEKKKELDVKIAIKMEGQDFSL